MIKIIMLLLLLVSCGKPKSKDKRQNQVVDEDGIFYGRIQPLNRSKANGQITITKAGDSVEVKILLKGVSNTTQYLYENNRCPIADLNSNGDIDINEVATQSGNRMVEFDVGTHESSYHLLLADLKRETMEFEVRTLVIFQGVDPVGCAELESVFAEPPEEEEAPRTTYKPPRPRPEPEIKPPPPPEPEPTSWWSRLSARLRRWWCRMRGRCS